MIVVKRNTAAAMLLFWGTTLAGCSATPIKPPAPQSVFQQTSEMAQKAALDAMVVNGFAITKAEPLYVEGYRLRTHGWHCSPGGETAGIWLEQTGPAQTRVWISTATSSFGRKCQKDWTGEILAEMGKVLGK